MIHWNVVRDHKYSILSNVIPSLHFISKLQKANYNLFDKSSLVDATPLPLLMLLGRTWATGVY
jgi:hypothetical protein